MSITEFNEKYGTKEQCREHLFKARFANAKAFILGTFHGLARTDLQTYLDKFRYRFNRRNIPDRIFDKLINSSLITKPLGYYSTVNMG